MNVPKCINTMDTVNESDLIQFEEIAYRNGDSLDGSVISKLIWEVRRLQHELNDPRFMYANARATRAAIVCRNEGIRRIERQLAEAKAGKS